MYEIYRETWVPRAPDEVFAFFSDAANLDALTPRWLRFEVLTPEARISAGAHIRYRLKWWGIPLDWTTQIAEWNPPRGFTDVQLKGPYRHWRHTHGFRAERGGTTVSDHVQYALPLGILGRLAHALVVRRDVARIFDYRAKRIRQLFAPATSTAEAPPARS